RSSDVRAGLAEPISREYEEASASIRGCQHDPACKPSEDSLCQALPFLGRDLADIGYLWVQDCRRDMVPNRRVTTVAERVRSGLSGKIVPDRLAERLPVTSKLLVRRGEGYFEEDFPAFFTADGPDGPCLGEPAATAGAVLEASCSLQVSGSRLGGKMV